MPYNSNSNERPAIREKVYMDTSEGVGANVDNDYDNGTRLAKGGVATTMPIDLSTPYSKADDDTFFGGCGPSSGSFDMERIGGRITQDKGGMYHNRQMPTYDQSPKMYDGMSPNLVSDNSWSSVFYMSPAMTPAYSRTKQPIGMGLQTSMALGGSNYVPQSVPHAKSRRRPAFSIMNEQTVNAGWNNGSASARNSAVVQYLNIGSLGPASSPPCNEVDPPGFPQLPGDMDNDKGIHSNLNSMNAGQGGLMGKSDLSSMNPRNSIHPLSYEASHLPAWYATPTHDWSDSVVPSQWIQPQSNIIPTTTSFFTMKGNSSSPVDYSSFPHYQVVGNTKDCRDDVPTEEVPGIPGKASIKNESRGIQGKEPITSDVSFSPWCNMDAVPEIRPAELGTSESKLNNPEGLASLAVGCYPPSNASSSTRNCIGSVIDLPITPPLVHSTQQQLLVLANATEDSSSFNRTPTISTGNASTLSNGNGGRSAIGTPSSASPMSNKSNNSLSAGGNQLSPNVNKNKSLGSAQHPNECRPCAFFWTKGCINGPECRFCHEWHPPKKKKPMKEQKNLMIIARPDGKIEFMRCTVYEAMRVL